MPGFLIFPKLLLTCFLLLHFLQWVNSPQSTKALQEAYIYSLNQEHSPNPSHQSVPLVVSPEDFNTWLLKHLLGSSLSLFICQSVFIFVTSWKLSASDLKHWTTSFSHIALHYLVLSLKSLLVHIYCIKSCFLSNGLSDWGPLQHFHSAIEVSLTPVTIFFTPPPPSNLPCLFQTDHHLLSHHIHIFLNKSYPWDLFSESDLFHLTWWATFMKILYHSNLWVNKTHLSTKPHVKTLLFIW